MWHAVSLIRPFPLYICIICDITSVEVPWIVFQTRRTRRCLCWTEPRRRALTWSVGSSSADEHRQKQPNVKPNQTRQMLWCCGGVELGSHIRTSCQATIADWLLVTTKTIVGYITPRKRCCYTPRVSSDNKKIAVCFIYISHNSM